MLKAALSEAEALRSDHSDDERLIRVISASQRAMGEALTAQGKFEEAIPVLEQALEELDAVDALVGEDTFATRGRAIANWRLAYALSQLGQDEEAVLQYDEAIKQSGKMLARSPDDPDARSIDVMLKAEKAAPLARLGRHEEAEKALRTQLEVYTDTYLKDTSAAGPQRAVLIAHYQLADFFKTTGNKDARCAEYDKFFDFLDMMEESGTLSPQDAAARPEFEAERADCP